MKKKRFILKFLKLTGLRKKKEKIPLRDSIRSRKVSSYYPQEWKAPVTRRLSTGEEITMLSIDSLVSTHNAIENWKKESI
jgi:hypothetical protein